MKASFIRQSTASLELMLAAALWGFGFVATVWALPVWAPVPMLFWRFSLGMVAGIFILAIGWRPNKSEFLWQLKASFFPAFFLVLMIALQTIGLLYTTATKSSFITILYVVLVPIMEGFVAGRKVSLQLWLCILASLIGVYLIVDPKWEESLNWGDFLTLLCSFAAALQIISVDRISRRIGNAFAFNTFQSAWAAPLLLLAMPIQSGPLFPSEPPTTLAWIGLLSLAFGSTLIAFYLQVRAQKVLSATVSSLFFLLESPFALLFAYFFLAERLNFQQGIGAGLILISALLATILKA